LVKSAALAAGVRGDLHSLRAGLAQPALKGLYGVIMESSRKSTLSGVEELARGFRRGLKAFPSGSAGQMQSHIPLHIHGPSRRQRLSG